LRVLVGSSLRLFVAAISFAALPAVAQVPSAGATYLPVTGGTLAERSVPFLTMAGQMAPFGYVEDEYVFSGEADIYDYVDNAAQSPLVGVVEEGLPYATRVLVRRPANPEDFNGTVILEVVNSTRGFDSDVIWQYSDQMIMDQGAVYVGMTSKTVAIDWLRDSFGEDYIPRNGERYASLLMVDDGQVWDMLSQTAALLKDDENDENPLQSWGVERIILAGYSQSAGYVKTYINSFHNFAVLEDGRYAMDGYFDAGGSFASKQPNPEGTGVEFNPGFDPRNRAVLPIPAPIIRFQTENEVASFFSSWQTRQTEAESPLVRTYEMTGGAHVDEYQKAAEEEQNIAELGLVSPWPACTTRASTLRVEYVHSALLQRLDEWLTFGKAPPASRLIESYFDEQNRFQVVRDADGIALGGVRLPQLDVPTGTWTGLNSEIWCILNGSYVPFSREELDARYPRRMGYIRASFWAIFGAYLDGFLLGRDALTIYREAWLADIGAWRWDWRARGRE